MRNYKKIILNNGIPLYLYNDPSLKQVFVNYIVKYGSSGEMFDFEHDGVKHHVTPGHAHFLEHLIGEHSSSGNIYSNFTNRCYYANAYTANNHTSYYFYGVKDVKKSIKELIEAIDRPVFDYKDVNHSRHAIEEEAATLCDDYKQEAVYLTERNLYGGVELYDDTLSPIGDRKTNHNITTRNLKKCYDAFYNDDNKVLVMAGNFNEKELVDYLNEVYANIPRHKSKLILPRYDYDPIRKKEDVIEKDNSENYDALGIKVKKPDGISDRDMYYFTDLLTNHIYYNDEFVDDLKNRGIVDNLHYCFYTTNGDYTNILHSYISPKPEEYMKRLLDKFNKKDMTKEEYELLRKTLISDEVRVLDNKYDMPSRFGERMFYTTDYSDIDYVRGFDYERFKDLYDKVNFDTYTTVKVKSKKK